MQQATLNNIFIILVIMRPNDIFIQTYLERIFNTLIIKPDNFRKQTLKFSDYFDMFSQHDH